MANKTLTVMGWWIRDYAYAVDHQLRAFFRGRDAADYRSGDGRTVVVLPGVWETWAFLRPLVERIHEAGHPVHVLPQLGRNGRPVDETAQVVADYLAANDLRDVALVAHSKGGLIGKYLMARLDPDDRVDRMVAVCTPFAGSVYAKFLLNPQLRAFSPDDPTTVMLRDAVDVNARITAISGVFDPHIPGLWELEGAHNVTLQTGGHFRLLGDADVVQLILDALAAPSPSPAA